MGIKIYQVDAFTELPFKGNPAAVCLLHEPRDETWMQNVAKEMNLSETAFLHRREEGFNLRWFTPAVEVELCGHATLASAHVLYETGLLDEQEQARFHTLSGLLTAIRRDEQIELNFPARPDEPASAPPGLLEALSVVPKYVGKTKYDYLLELDSEEAVRNLSPDFAMLKAQAIRGVMVTSVASTEGFDFVSRFFAPGAGIDEDPVTGAAHCCLGPYWRRRLGKDEFVAYQASARGGIVHVRVEGERVILGGHAVTILRGELTDVSSQYSDV
ncbi:MAG: PhzF family phenazine biosynthesis protein [Anaerolineaceae bacterium]|nr:MAG: PhzF family phenazine biosynthesis protein [Anaerolineaceae bacterium]